MTVRPGVAARRFHLMKMIRNYNYLQPLYKNRGQMPGAPRNQNLAVRLTNTLLGSP